MRALILAALLLGASACSFGDECPEYNPYNAYECETLRFIALSNSSDSEDAAVDYDVYCDCE